MDMLFGILFILFMFIGVLFSVYFVFYNLLKPKKKKSAIVLVFDSESQDIRQQLGFIDFQRAVSGAGKAVIIDNGMNNVQRMFCERFCGENSSAVLINPGQITEVL
ncbi:MAG: hypothetical protein K5755_02510 [Clostridiales bacterium]|nr:hypothetical protein [Clostridia bacterium]MCR4563491.1 hypothetical protein [Clostridiales bacterium]